MKSGTDQEEGATLEERQTLSEAIVGRSRPEIEALLVNARRAKLLDLIYFLATYEPKLTPQQIAQANQIGERAVIGKLKSGEIPGAQKPLENGWRVPISCAREWDRKITVHPRRG